MFVQIWNEIALNNYDIYLILSNFSKNKGRLSVFMFKTRVFCECVSDLMRIKIAEQKIAEYDQS